jgi:hypothetical protein
MSAGFDGSQRRGIAPTWLAVAVVFVLVVIAGASLLLRFSPGPGASPSGAGSSTGSRATESGSSGAASPALSSSSAPSTSADQSASNLVADPSVIPQALMAGGLYVFDWGDGPEIAINGIRQPKVPCGQSSRLAPGHGLPAFPWRVTAVGGKEMADFGQPSSDKAFVLELMPDGRWVTSIAATAPVRPAVCPLSWTFDDAKDQVHFQISEPNVTTPGRMAGKRIAADITAVLDDHIAYLVDWVTQGRTAFPDPSVVASVPTSYRVLGYAQPASDASAGIVSFELDYVWNVPTADAGPQWVDVLSYDLSTGNRIGIGDLFTNTEMALGRISGAIGKDKHIVDLYGPYGSPNPSPDPGASFDIWGSGYGPYAQNFGLWAPTPAGLRITFAWMQLGYAAAGTPSTIVPWADLRDLIAPDSYLGWYLAEHT